MRPILFHLAKEMGHIVHEMVVSSAAEHILNETAMNDKQSSGKGKRSTSWSKSDCKGKSKVSHRKNRGTSKGSKGAKGSYKRKTSKTGLSGLEKTRHQRQVQKLRNLHRRIPLTIHTRTIPGVMMAGVTMDGMLTGARLDGMKVGNKPVTIPQTHFSLESFDLGAISSPKRFEWVKLNVDTGAAAKTFPLNFGQMDQEMEDSIEQPVVSVFLTVELASFKVAMKTVCVDLRTEDSLVHTKCCAVLVKSRAKDVKIGQEMRMHFERLVRWYGRKQLLPVCIEDNIFNFCLSKETESTETNTVNNSQQPGNEHGGVVHS